MRPRRQRHGPLGAGLPIGRASRSRSPCGPPPRDVHASPQDRPPRIGTLKCSRRSAVRGPGSTRTSIRFVPGPPGRAARFQAGPTRLLPGSARRIVIGEEVVFKPGFVSCTRRWPRCCTITPHGFTTSTEERAAFRQRDLHRRAQRTVAAPRVEGAPCCRRQLDRASNRRLRRPTWKLAIECQSPHRSLWPLKKKLPQTAQTISGHVGAPHCRGPVHRQAGDRSRRPGASCRTAARPPWRLHGREAATGVAHGPSGFRATSTPPPQRSFAPAPGRRSARAAACSSLHDTRAHTAARVKPVAASPPSTAPSRSRDRQP